MRVAYICVDPGVPVFGTKGASVHVQEIVRAWRARGVDVHIYCTRVGEDRPDDLADVPVTHVPVGKGTGDTERQRAADREKQVVAAARRIADAVIADGADAVYERFGLFSVAMAVAATTLGVPGYLEVNAPLIDEQREHRVLVDEPAARAEFRAQLRSAAAVAAVSEPVAGWCLETSGDPTLGERLVVVPNGVDVERIRPVAPGPKPVALFVGTLKSWHGTETLIRAAAEARERWRVRIVGDGPEAGALRSLAAELGVDVEFTGAVAPSRIPSAMAGAWVAVAPYPEAEDQYFSPLKVFEYQAAALPVVASAVGQIPAIVRHDETGLLVPPSSPARLAAAIDALVADPARAMAMGQAGRALVAQRHTWHSVLARTLEGAKVHV